MKIELEIDEDLWDLFEWYCKEIGMYPYPYITECIKSSIISICISNTRISFNDILIDIPVEYHDLVKNLREEFVDE